MARKMRKKSGVVYAEWKLCGTFHVENYPDWESFIRDTFNPEIEFIIIKEV